MNSTAALWLTIIALGLYHGLNPAMGWPLAVANAMMDRSARSLFATLLPLSGGHLMAMAVVLAPLAWLGWYVQYGRAIRIGAGAALLLLGLFKLVRRRHPRALARIAPARLAWWSFLMATAHGAGLMLAPFMLGLCVATGPAPGAADMGHAAVMNYTAQSTLGIAALVAAVHTLAGFAAAMAMAWLVYRHLGLRFLRHAWLNLDLVWGGSLAVAGVAGIALAI
ncbi:hypothetical protein [Noviherbaspirillum soli]|uniref:hypothetical protein n=1 Tax=Noviherbaspirillum soli TaxID=1064518 RepID=UPI001E5CEC4A|nr:hypothetical protein [Noviherbaspirillum soli]